MKYLVVILIVTGFSLNAQTLDKSTSAMDKPGGTPLFELEEGQEVYSYEPENNWYRIRKMGRVLASELADEKYLREGTVLRDKKGNRIGEVLSETEVKDKKKIETFRGDTYYEVIVEGYVFKTAMEDGSVPEERVSELLQIKNRTEQEEGFKQLFSTYDFESRTFDEGLMAYVLRERNKSTAEESDFRLIIIYRDKSSLYALITNGHQLQIPKIKDEYMEGPFKITYLYKPTAAQKEVIEDKILYTYQAL